MVMRTIDLHLVRLRRDAFTLDKFAQRYGALFFPPADLEQTTAHLLRLDAVYERLGIKELRRSADSFQHCLMFMYEYGVNGQHAPEDITFENWIVHAAVCDFLTMLVAVANHTKKLQPGEAAAARRCLKTCEAASRRYALEGGNGFLYEGATFLES